MNVYMHSYAILIMHSAAPGDGLWFEVGKRERADEKWWAAQVRILEGLHQSQATPLEVAMRLEAWGFVDDAASLLSAPA